MERILVLLVISAASVFVAPATDRATWKRYAVTLPEFATSAAKADGAKFIGPWSK